MTARTLEAAAAVARRRRRAGGFDARRLYMAGEAGAWYDPSDLTAEKVAWVAANPGFTSAQFLAAFPNHTLYQDSAGTTPVTALGQPVGLVIDSKTGGLANVGVELVTNGDFPVNTTGWTAGNSPVLTVGANGVTIQNNGGSAGYLYQAMTTVIGRSYLITGSIVYGGTGFARIEVSNTITNPGGGNINASASGSYRWAFTATAATTYIIIGNRNDTNAAHTYDNISVREVPGVHAIQPTSASRPLLDGRVNLLTFSEQFDNAYWTKFQTTITANAAVAPDGTTTADKMVANTTNAQHSWSRSSAASAGTYTATVYAKAAEYNTIQLYLFHSVFVGQATARLDLGTVSIAGSGSPIGSIENVGNGWCRVSLTATAAGTVECGCYIGNNGSVSAFAGDNTSGVLFWGADLRLASDAAYPYQRVAAATDYADVGVPRSFLFDGFDDSLYTASNMDLSGTDKVTVLAGVRKLSDAARGIVFEPNAASTNRVSLEAPTNTGANNVQFASGGGVTVAAQATGLASPVTFVVAGLSNVAADICSIRINGALAATTTTDQGTGTFFNAVANIGRRDNTSLPFNGKAYQLIVRGALTDAATLVQAERFVAQRTGITL